MDQVHGKSCSYHSRAMVEPFEQIGYNVSITQVLGILIRID